MPDIAFRLTSAGASAVLSSVGDVATFVRTQNEALQASAKSMFGAGVGFSGLGSQVQALGPTIRSARVEFDALNKSAKVFQETGINLPTSKAGVFEFMSTGEVQSALVSSEKLTASMKSVSDATLEMQRVQKTVGEQVAAPHQSQISALQQSTTARASILADAKTQVAAYQTSKQEITAAMKGRVGGLTTFQNAETAQLSALQTESAAKVAAATEVGGTEQADAIKAQAEKVRLAEEQMKSAYITAANPAPTPAYASATLAASPQLSALLQKNGLQMGNLATTTNFNQPYEDLVRNVTKVGGSFTDTAGKVKSFGAEIGANGQVITRFGGQLSGMSNFLAQIQRDFVKVVEWTVATTVVIGALGASMGAIKNINEIDQLVQKLGITAQMSTAQARSYFDTVAQVAYETATPLNEMLASVDDIALATKRAGQSTDEWHIQMNSLMFAVGVYTNIAGVDTVTATDDLTAAMKQLGLHADDMINVLNKVSAVASGQANAIAEIMKGLSVMGETASTAGLNLDQMIGFLQVLGQVTGKSASEVAVSFKNLVGSIDSTASIKMLDKFGIQVKDAQGNARDFLSILQDVYTAIQTGEIPEGQKKAVEKAMAGGPRRAPDLAAILSNFAPISDSTTIAANASNNALVANAKILETNSAKITQLKTKLDSLMFDTFGPAMRDAITSVSSAIIKLINVIQGIPTGWIEGAVKVVAFIAAIKIAQIAVSLITSTYNGLSGMLTGIIVKTAEWGVTQKAVAAAAMDTEGFIAGGTMGAAAGAKGAAGTIAKDASAGFSMSGLVGMASKSIAPAMVGATAAQLVGANMTQTIGASMAAAGAYMSLTGALTPLGIGLIAVGGALALFTGDSKKATDALNGTSDAVLSAATAYTTAKLNTTLLVNEQDALIKQVGQLGAAKDTASMYAKMDAETQLADTTAKLFAANTDLTKSYSDLSAAMAGSGGDIPGMGPGYADLIAAVSAGTATAEQISQVYSTLQLLYLKAAYPNMYISPTELGKGPPTLTFQSSLPNAIPTPPSAAVDNTNLTDQQKIAQSMWGTKTVPDQGATFGATPQQTPIEAFKSMFQDNGSGGLKLNPGTVIDKNSAATLWGGTAQFKDQISNIKDYTNALTDAKVPAGDLTAATEYLAKAQAYLNTEVIAGVSGMTQDKVNSVMGNLNFASSMLTALESNPIKPDSFGKVDPSATNAAIKGVQDYMKAVSTMNGDPVKTNTKAWYALVAAESLVNPAFASMDLPTQVAMLRDMKVTVDYLGIATNKAAVDYTELATAIDDSTTAAEAKIAADILSVKSQVVSKAITPAIGKADLSQLTAMQTGYAKLDAIFQQNTDIVPVLQEQLGSLAGMESILHGKTEDTGIAILDMARTMGASGTQINGIIDTLIKLATALQLIEDTPAIVLDITTRITAESNLVGAAPEVAALKDQASADKAAAAKAVKEVQNYYKSIQQEVLGGGPINTKIDTPKTPKAAPALVVPSTVEIPQQWIDTKMNIMDTMNKAIAWAKKYEAAIPNATAASKGDVVAVMEGNTRVLLKVGLSADALSKGMAAQTDAIKANTDVLTKADTIRRIRVGAGDFAALANVPTNAASGVSVGSPQGPITISLNITGQVLTKAQMDQLGNAVAAGFGNQISGG